MKQLLLFTITFFLTLVINGQSIQSAPAFGGIRVLEINSIDNNIGGYEYSEEDKIKLLQKKYLTHGYNASFIDEFKTTAYVRYNLFDDQMEFVKGENIYFLKKELNRKIRFTTLNITYKAYDLKGELHFFAVHVEGENSLLAKQSVRFVKPKKATTTYGKDKPADFKRNKDELYLAINNKKLIKIPTNKKKFYTVFGSKSSDIKSYMKKNKLSYKNFEDVKKAVFYFNTL